MEVALVRTRRLTARHTPGRGVNVAELLPTELAVSAPAPTGLPRPSRQQPHLPSSTHRPPLQLPMPR